MKPPAILDADMATVARWSRSGFVWWIEELNGLVPPWLRRLVRPDPGVVAHYDGEQIALSRGGAKIERGASPLAVALSLPPEAALVRDIWLPALGSSDLRQLVELDADRLLPFTPGSALIDFTPGAIDERGLQAVRVAGLPLPTADAAIAAAVAIDLDVRQLRIASDTGALAFDFLPAWRIAHAVPGNAPRQFWWVVVAAAFLLNLGLMIALDIHDLAETRALVEAHGQTAATARLLRSRVVSEDARRRNMLARRQLHDPLGILAETTRLLPDQVWVQRLSWDGVRLRLAGYKPATTDVVAALRRSPLFAEVRSAATDVPAQSATGQPFDVTAERRP
jgi:Tfp pilus assembly protein PilN